MAQYVKDARKLAYQTTLTTENLEACVRGQEIELAFIVDITSADSNIQWHYSNRHINVGGTFYEGRLKTPQLSRRMSELFTPDIQLTEVTFDIWAGDDALNDYLPTGSSYSPLIGASCVIKIGFPANEASFTTLFDGVVHFEGAMTRNREYISIRARDKVTQKLLGYPQLIRVGDGSTISQVQVAEGGMAFPWVGKKLSKTISNPEKLLAANSASFYGLRTPVYMTNGTDGYAYLDITPNSVAVGGSYRTYVYKEVIGNTCATGSINDSSTTYFGRNMLPVYFVPSGGSREVYFDDSLFSSVDTGAAVRSFAINIAGLSSAEIMSEASLAGLFYTKMDIICDDSKRTNISYIASWAKQSGLDCYISSAGVLSFKPFFTSSMPTLASMRRITNQSIVEDSLQIEMERSNLLTAANATYVYNYQQKNTAQATRLLKHTNAETKYGKRLAKTVDFPSIASTATASEVETHLAKFIRLMAAGLEFITVELTYDWLTLELGDWVKLYVTAQAADFRDTPAQVREITYKLDTGTIVVKLLSYANFPNESFTPSNAARCVSAYNSTVTNAF